MASSQMTNSGCKLYPNEDQAQTWESQEETRCGLGSGIKCRNGGWKTESSHTVSRQDALRLVSESGRLSRRGAPSLAVMTGPQVRNRCLIPRRLVLSYFWFLTGPLFKGPQRKRKIDQTNAENGESWPQKQLREVEKLGRMLEKVRQQEFATLLERQRDKCNATPAPNLVAIHSAKVRSKLRESSLAHNRSH